MASDTGELHGISVVLFHAFRTGIPSTNRQMYPSKLPNSFRTRRNALALPTAARILSRFLMIPGSESSIETSLSENRETAAASKFRKAFLYPSRFLRTVDQLNP